MNADHIVALIGAWLCSSVLLAAAIGKVLARCSCDDDWGQEIEGWVNEGREGIYAHVARREAARIEDEWARMDGAL